ncbi:MAG: LysR family transcriptional regulator [Rhodocyclaceae bacterium]|nr:LysR family transcriptional regulator [Rhodocyclaceae bacterium]
MGNLAGRSLGEPGSNSNISSRVAELGSFSKAALILNIAQPALSRQVRLLETDLHATLLQRTGRGVVLTEAGKRLFDHSIGILQLVSRVREDIASSRDEPAGRLVVGLPPSMGRLLTLPLVEEFRRVLPKARLAIVEGLSTHLSEWISTGRVDLGLLHNPRVAGRPRDHAGAGRAARPGQPGAGRSRQESQPPRHGEAGRTDADSAHPART